MTKYDKYLTTYYGRDLLIKHALAEYGIWRVHGEDPNCDMGGSHIQPDMGVYEGTLEDVLKLVTSMPVFWAWGAGGRVEKTNINFVDANTLKDRDAKRARLKELEARLNELKKDLGKEI